jgi:nucleotide-binding universal stress UspA family protein
MTINAADTIVVGIDDSTPSRQALAWTVVQARAEQRAITLVHALPATTPALLDPSADNPRQAHERSIRAKGQEVLDRARDEAHQLAPDVTVHQVFLLEDPRRALVEVSETASLLVLGSRGRGHLAGLLLGSTAGAVVRHARSPVVVHRTPRPGTPDAGTERRGIAVGADASADSLPVLEFAYRHASLRGLPLTVVHSFWYFQQPAAAAEGAAALATSTEEQRDTLAESLAGFAEKYPDVEVHTEIEQGMPERYLLRIADRMNLLVVGAHHGSRARQFMFGSVSVWLVEHASCPVAVVPLSHDQP